MTALLCSSQRPFPVDDWQFWAATLIFALAAAWLLRPLLPIPWLHRRHASRSRARKVRLTIEGRTPGGK